MSITPSEIQMIMSEPIEDTREESILDHISDPGLRTSVLGAFEKYGQLIAEGKISRQLASECHEEDKLIIARMLAEGPVPFKLKNDF